VHLLIYLLNPPVLFLPDVEPVITVSLRLLLGGIELKDIFVGPLPSFGYVSEEY
jgi:hypothetical protein